MPDITEPIMVRWCLFPQYLKAQWKKFVDCEAAYCLCVCSAHLCVQACAFWRWLFLTSCCRFPLCAWWWLHGPTQGLRVRGPHCWTVGAQRRLNLVRIQRVPLYLMMKIALIVLGNRGNTIKNLYFHPVIKQKSSKTGRAQSPLPSPAFVSLSPWTWIINTLPGVCYNRPAATHTGSGDMTAEPLIHHRFNCQFNSLDKFLHF